MFGCPWCVVPAETDCLLYISLVPDSVQSFVFLKTIAWQYDHEDYGATVGYPEITYARSSVQHCA